MMTTFYGDASDFRSHESHGATVSGITVFCHFRIHYLMPVIICKNDKHLVTLIM